MMHAKTIVVDDAWTLIGSANMDERSMELNEENALGIADHDFAGAVAAGNEQDFARSREIHLKEWVRRPWYRRVLERLARILVEQY
jgi:cardiolipin synthase